MPGAVAKSKVDAHRQAVTMDVAGIARYLQEMYGQKLVAHMAGIDDPKRVGKWAQGEQAPRSGAEERMRAAYQITHLLLAHDSDHVVRAWFIGMNPQLDDEAPADAIRAGQLKEVLAAAKAFVSGG